MHNGHKKDWAKQLLPRAKDTQQWNSLQLPNAQHLKKRPAVDFQSSASRSLILDHKHNPLEEQLHVKYVLFLLFNFNSYFSLYITEFVDSFFPFFCNYAEGFCV